MIADHHARSIERATLLVRAVDEILGTHRVIGLVGPNGAGKTTLLRLAVGTLSPSAGEITVLGQAVTDRPESLAAVGFVGQEMPLYPAFTVEEMLRFGARLNPRWNNAIPRHQLARLGIPLDQRTGRLSGGQTAQVALAIALESSRSCYCWMSRWPAWIRWPAASSSSP